jgi:8-oxo-dGTP pyrophosphatase MutT (NUDIX family)
MDSARPEKGDSVTEVVPIRAAATMILVRDAQTRPSVLMGQRGRGAVFMPNKFVFPGGAVDPEDAEVRLAGLPSDRTVARLGTQAAGLAPETLAVTAIRELWEETGLRFARPGTWDAAPPGWEAYGAHPTGEGLEFFFRAITPPGRPRRFDARFFLASADALLDGPDDHVPSSDELSHLSWVPLDEVRRLDMAFITQLVLAELARHLPRLDAPERVPFIRNDQVDNTVVWL